LELDVFSFIPTMPNALVEIVNHAGMPVILTSEADHDTWMNHALACAQV
jgi:hypothetical protein